MSFTLNALLSLFIAVPVATGWIRYRKFDAFFLPILLVLTAGLASELAGIYLAVRFRNNAPSFNIYSLVESVLLLWQFRRWEVISSRMIYFLLQVALTAIWIWDSFFLGNMFQFNSVHLVVCSSVVTVLSLDMMNRMIYRHPGPVLKNTAFLLCTGLLVFNMYTILVELSWLHGATKHSQFRIHLLSILSFVNLFCNLLFTLALLWAPTHFRYWTRSLPPVH